MTLTEFIHKIGFDIDYVALQRLNDTLYTIDEQVKDTFQGLERISKGISKVGKQLSVAVTAPIVALGIASLKTSGDIEQLKVALGELIPQGKEEYFKKLDAFTRKSNFDKSQVYSYANALLQAKVPLKDTITMMEQLGNISAVDSKKSGKVGGKGDIQAMVDTLARLKTQGKIEAGAVQALGPAVMLQLQKQLGMSGAMFTAFMGTGVVKYADVMKAVSSVAEERAGAMNSQMKTFNGLVFTTVQALNELAGEFGDMLVKELKLKEFFTFIIKSIRNFVDWLKQLNPWARKFIIFLVAMVALAGPLLVFVGAIGQLAVGVTAAAFAFTTLLPAISGLVAGIAPVLATIGGVLALLYLIYDEVSVWVDDGDSLLGRALGSWKDFADNLKIIIEGIKTTIKELDLKKGVNMIAEGAVNMVGDSFVGRLVDKYIKEPMQKYQNQQSTQIVVNQTIPAGTPAMQAQFIKDSTSKAWDAYANYQEKNNSRYTFDAWQAAGSPAR